jgi:hypothetical protein
LKEGEYPTKADSHGMIKLSGSNADTLYLLFELVPERVSSFAIDTKTRNNFVFTFEPWAVEIFFKDFELTIDGNDLTGNIPLLIKKIVFTKRKNKYSAFNSHLLIYFCFNFTTMINTLNKIFFAISLFVFAACNSEEKMASPLK